MMNALKTTLASIFLMSTVVSTTAFANTLDVKVLHAGETTLSKTQEAYDLLEKGGDKAEVLKLLSDVRQAQKEFRFEATERLRQKAGNYLKAAREELEKGEATAVPSLKATLDAYKEMMVIYKAAH